MTQKRLMLRRVVPKVDDSALRRRYKAAREMAKLRDVKLHGLRHAAGSIYARQAAALPKAVWAARCCSRPAMSGA